MTPHLAYVVWDLNSGPDALRGGHFTKSCAQFWRQHGQKVTHICKRCLVRICNYLDIYLTSVLM